MENLWYFACVTFKARQYKGEAGRWKHDETRRWQQQQGIRDRSNLGQRVYTRESKSGHLPGLYYLVY